MFGPAKPAYRHGVRQAVKGKVQEGERLLLFKGEGCRGYVAFDNTATKPQAAEESQIPGMARNLKSSETAHPPLPS